LHRTLIKKYPGIAELHQAGPMTLYLRLSGDVKQTDAKRMIREILANERYVKQVVVFDQDVDLKNAQQVNKALATMVQADRDILILPDQIGNGVDPSECNGRTTKWGIDATTKALETGKPARSIIPQIILDKIMRQALV
jgi:UbiD family decarboxylase